MNKWIKVEKEKWNFSAYVLLFNKIRLYAGKTDHWGIGVEVCFYDRSLTFEILNLYTGVEILYSENKEGDDNV
jgi:hypothetical protein